MMTCYLLHVRKNVWNEKKTWEYHEQVWYLITMKNFEFGLHSTYLLNLIIHVDLEYGIRSNVNIMDHSNLVKDLAQIANTEFQYQQHLDSVNIKSMVYGYSSGIFSFSYWQLVSTNITVWTEIRNLQEPA